MRDDLLVTEQMTTNWRRLRRRFAAFNDMSFSLRHYNGSDYPLGKDGRV